MRSTPFDAAAGLQAVLNGLPAMIGYWDRDLRNQMANDAYVRFFGWTPERMRGVHIRDVLGEELYAKNLPFMQRALAGDAQLFDREIRTPSGDVRYTQASYIPDRVEGEVHGFFVLVTDITERRQAEAALHESEERYRTLIEQLPGGAVTLVDSNLRMQWFGGGVVHEAGLDVAAMLDRPVRETTGGGSHGEMIEALYARALAGEHISTDVHSKITDRDFHLEIGPLRDRAGAVTAAMGVAQDITERKRTEAHLRLQSEISDNMAEGALLMRESDLVIIHANPAAERIFGYGPGEMTGRHVASLNAAGDTGAEELAADIARQVAAAGGRWSGDVESVRKNGSVFWRHSSISTFEDPDLGPLLVSVVADVTRQREQDAEERARGEIARLVAEGVGRAALFAEVACQAALIFAADAAVLVRHDPETGCGHIVGAAGDDGERLVGATIDLTGDWSPAFGSPAAVPIVVDRRQWGSLVVGFGNRAAPDNTAERLRSFSGLVSLAIANVEAWDALSRQAATDSITGLANHRAWQERLGSEVRRVNRYGRNLSVVMFDIDHFKQINDRFGHGVGDEVLAEFARRLQREARDSELVARIGGEEFAWLLPETGTQDAFAAAERVRVAIATEPFQVVGTLTVSAGVCSMQRGVDLDELMRCADAALYRAKDSGRNATVAHAPASMSSFA